MKTSTRLKRARELIANKRNWTVRTFARDRNKASCSIYSRRATCFCAGGALMRVSRGLSYEPYRTVREYLIDAAYLEFGKGVTVVNDRCGHAAVLRMYDIAISMALSDEAEREGSA